MYVSVCVSLMFCGVKNVLSVAEWTAPTEDRERVRVRVE